MSEFGSRRSEVIGSRGMVAASQPLAAEAGLAILRAGGNAVDAAVAAGAVLAVVQPMSTGMGGDVFALTYDAASGRTTALNGSGRTPFRLELSRIFQRGRIESVGDPHAVTVPGAVRGWEDLVHRHGTFPLGRLLEEAIFFAEEGYPVAPVTARIWAATEKMLRCGGAGGEVFLPGGRSPKAGERVRLPGMARVFRSIAEGGADAFYGGEAGEAIVRAVRGRGGYLEPADLLEHRSEWGEPIDTAYHGFTVEEHPPNGQGLAVLLALNLLRGFDLQAAPFDGPARLHLLIEALRLAFADAHRYVADPQHGEIPLGQLLSERYAEDRRKLIDPRRAMDPPSFGIPWETGDTVYLCTIDGAGNACSFINSIYAAWGSAIVAGETGIVLQNRALNFSLLPGHPNAIAPGKRPFHTIIPGMLRRDGKLWGPFGVMGGFMQPQGHLQVLTGLIDDAVDSQAALDRPRFCIMGGDPAGTIALEQGIPASTLAALEALGHPVKAVSGIVPRQLFGNGQIIRTDGTTYFGGSDPRIDGLVAAW